MTRTLAALLLVLALGVTTRAARSGQEAPAAAPQHEAAHAEAAEGEHAHESGWFPTIAKMFNFAVLVGVLVYFLRAPLTVYLNCPHRRKSARIWSRRRRRGRPRIALLAEIKPS